MGIPGLLNQIGKGERVALAKLAIDHYEKTNRPLRIAIDAAIWQFQHQSAQGGKNPELRTLFFRLLKLLALPIQPVFVYDGKNKPLTKRGKTVSRYGTCIANELSKNLVARFQFPHHTAPGEAEAECAFLQKNGIVDAVMSQDVDAIMFGATLTLRDWSKEGTKGNKTPTHVNAFSRSKIEEVTGLDPEGMILYALLSGGDYHEGILGFGAALSCSVAKAGFGTEMIKLVLRNDEQGLREWRERLQYELETNESGYFSKRHKTLKIPPDFPDRSILSYFLAPAVSKSEDLKKLERKWLQWWEKEIDIQELRQYASMTFDWMYKGGAKKFIRCFAQPLFQHRLRTKRVDINDFSVKFITERRQHFVSDGIPELRFSAVPGDVVGIDLDAEEENPEYSELEVDDGADDIEVVESAARDIDEPGSTQPPSPSKRRKRPPWDPSIVEKWWIPEPLLKVGLPTVVEDWHEEQRAIRADPIKFATRKCKQPASAARNIDKSMKQGALKQYLPTVKLVNTNGIIEPELPTHFSLSKNSSDLTEDSANVMPLSQKSRVDNYFKPVRLSKAASDTKLAAEQHNDTPSSTAPAEYVDVVTRIPSSVTQRKKARTKKDQQSQKPLTEEDDDEVVFVGASKAPPPISSFFGSNAGSSNGRRRVEKEVLKLLATPDMVARKPAKKQFVAMSRDSLPGAWKELSQTPLKGSRVSFIDLTDD